MTLDDLRDYIKQFLKTRQNCSKTEVDNLQDQENFIGSGLVDSFCFIDMCLNIEEHFNVSIDISDLAETDFCINGLHKYICKNQ